MPVSSRVRDAVLIVNPVAGGGRRMRQLDKARGIFRNAGIETELRATSAPGEATEMAHRAVAAFAPTRDRVRRRRHGE